MTANPLPPIPPIGPTTGMAMPGAAQARFKPIDPLKLLRQHIILLIVTFVIGVGLGVGIYFLLKEYAPSYTSSAQLRVYNAITDADNVGMMEDTASQQFIRNEMARISSPEVLRDAVNIKDLVQDTGWYAQFEGPQEAREALQEKHLRVASLSGSTIIQVSVSTGDEKEPDRILEAVLRTYQSQLKSELSREFDEQRRVLLEEKKRLGDNERLLQEQQRNFFTQGDDLSQLTTRRQETSLILNRLTSQQVQLELALEASKESLQNIQKAEGQLQPTSDDIVIVDNHTEVMPKTQRINNLMETKQSYIDLYGPRHPQVKQIEVQIRAAELDRQRVFDKLMADHLRRKVESSQNAVEAYTAQLEEINLRLEEAQIAMADHESRQTEYEQLESDLEETRNAKIENDRNLTDLRIMAIRPDAIRVRRQQDPTAAKMTFPNPLVIVPGVTILMLGSVGGLVFLKELLDQRVKSPADVKLLANADLLGVIPHIDEDPSDDEDIERIVERAPNGLIAESYRQVRTAILGKMDRRGYKTLMVVGAQPECGSTSFAQNLATSLAFNGRNVLMVDANFRRPSMHDLMGVENRRGLANVLRGDIDLEDAITPFEGQTLSILTAGPTEDRVPEMLEGSQLRSLLGDLESRYDMIVIDAPPALLASDAQLMAKHVDAISVVVKADRDKRGMLERMLRQLDGQRADLLGVVLNAARSAAGGYFRKSYEDFYKYSQQGGSELRPAELKPAMAKSENKEEAVTADA